MGNCGSHGSVRTVSGGGIHSGNVTNNANGATKITNKRSSKIILDVMGEVRRIQMKGVSMSYSLSYCYVSQRGYYPENPSKANQDSYLIYENVGGELALFSSNLYPRLIC